MHQASVRFDKWVQGVGLHRCAPGFQGATHQAQVHRADDPLVPGGELQGRAVPDAERRQGHTVVVRTDLTDLAVLARADRYATGARGIPGSSAVGLWCYDRFTLAVPPSSVVTLWSESEGVQQVDELVHRLVHRSDRVGRGGGEAKSPLPAGLHSALGTRSEE